MLKYKKLKLTPALDFDVENCSWEDVLDQMTRAKGDYEDRAKGLKNTFRKVWRKMGDDAVQSYSSPVLDMMPSDYGLSTVRAGLAFVFYVRKLQSSHRECRLSSADLVPPNSLQREPQRNAKRFLARSEISLIS